MQTIRYLFLIVLVIQLAFGSCVQANLAWASQYPYKIRILEVTGGGHSDLSSALGNLSSFSLKTVSMKTFVAQREDLAGNYDVVYIGSGRYSSAGVSYNHMEDMSDQKSRTLAHNTLSVMNDITNLKAQEIKREFIDKGQLVILHEDTVKQSGVKLKSNFQSYRTNQKSNVVFVTSGEQAKNVMLDAFSTGSKRPRIDLADKPDEYPLTNTVYHAGQEISFSFQMLNKHLFASRPLTANLYMDANFDKRYVPEELVKTVQVTGQTGNLTYLLPTGFSGVRYWKLEIVDEQTGLSEYQTGAFRFQDEKVLVKVLQVTKDDKSVKTNLNDRINSSYLDTPDYRIQIEVAHIDQFNSNLYQKLNGTYDMLIFGFRDVYNETAISDKAAQAVQTFINTGQSVMFTHDTIYRTNNKWVQYFMDDTGQKPPMHNLGLGAPTPSSNTNKINEGLLTQFPFILDNDISIALTHNQYYTLDLEDPEVISWYNIAGGNRDVHDSWNHYYTYSKGNVTYSGTGHITSGFGGFPDEEQRLFVNTMYRAFIGSNHAPMLQVVSPVDGAKIRSTDKMVDIVFTPHDYDLKDFLLKTKIYVDGQLAYNNDRVSNGSTVIYSAPNTKAQGGTIHVKIELEDSTGAKVFAERTITVEQVSPNLVLSRKLLDPDNTVSKNEPFMLEYSIEPRDINMDELKMSGLRPLWMPHVDYEIGSEYSLVEKYKGNFGPIAWTSKNDRAGFLKLLKEGYHLPVSVNGTIDTHTGNSLKDEIAEGLAYLAHQKATIILPVIEDSVLKGNSTEAPIVNFGRFEVIEKTVMKNKNQTETGYYGVFKGYVYDLDNNQLVIKNLLFSEQFPEGLTVESSSENWRSSGPVSGQISITGKLGDITYRRAGDVFKAQKKTFTLTLKASRSGLYTLDQAKLAYTDVNQTEGNDSFNNLTVKVYTPVKGVTLNKEQLVLKADDPARDSERLIATVTPADADNKNVRWKSSDTRVATVDSTGRVQAVGTGTAIITVTTEDGGYTDTCLVTVTGKPEVSLSVRNQDGTISGWEQMYPDQGVVTVEVIYGSHEGPITLDFRIEDQRVSQTDISGPITTNLGNGQTKATYTVNISHNQMTYGGPFVGPVRIVATAKTAYGQESDHAENSLIFNPITRFNVTGIREGLTQKGTLTAVPLTKVMDDVKYGWLYQKDAGNITSSTVWNPFSDGNVARNVPLYSGPTPFVVAMLQDFNRDGDYSDQHEINVDQTTISGLMLPAFEAEFAAVSGQNGIIMITPDLSTITALTKWTYAASDPGHGFSVDPSNEVAFISVPFHKNADGKLIDTAVTIKAVNSAQLSDELAATRVVLMKAPIEEDHGDDDKYNSSPYLYITHTNQSQENRATEVTVGYSFRALDLATTDIRILHASYSIDGKTYSIQGQDLQRTSFEKVLNLKTSNSKTKQIIMRIDVRIAVDIKKKNKNGVYEVVETITDEFSEWRPITVVASSTLQ